MRAADVSHVTNEAVPKKQKSEPPTDGPLGRGTVPAPLGASGHAMVLGHANVVGPFDPEGPVTVGMNGASGAPAHDAWPRLVHAPGIEPSEIAGASVSPRGPIIANWLSIASYSE